MKRSWAPLILLAPYLLITGVFFVLPLLDAAGLAFYQTNGARSRAWVGLENFAFVLGDPDFHRAVRNTLVFALASLCIQLPLSLGLALLLAQGGSRSVRFLRLVLFSPNLVGQIFVGVMFSVLFLPRFGLANQGIFALSGWGLEQGWLTDASLVMPAIVLTSLWMYVGFNMLYFLAALQGVDRSLIEAALLDGAGPWQRFRHVVLPAIKPVLIFVVLTSTIGSFQLFELPYSLLNSTGSPFGPDNAGLFLVSYLYRYVFLASDLGTGAAVGWILTFLIYLISLAQIRLMRSRGDA